MKVKHDLLTSNHTEVLHERPEEFVNGAPHHFYVRPVGGFRHLASVDFQSGPVNEVGVNGIRSEDLIVILICQLEHFQKTEYSSRDNAMAITKLEEALLWLRKRTIGRENRGVEGTSKL